MVFDNFPKGLILLIVIIIIIGLLLIALIEEGRDIYGPKYDLNGGKGKIHYKGLGSSDEDLETLLNRIYWVADADGRNTKWKRAYIIAILATFIIFALLYKDIPSIRDILLVLLIIFISVYAIFGYFRFHSDRFSPYYIRKNIIYILDKLNLKYKKPPTPLDSSKVPDYYDLGELV